MGKPNFFCQKLLANLSTEHSTTNKIICLLDDHCDLVRRKKCTDCVSPDNGTTNYSLCIPPIPPLLHHDAHSCILATSRAGITDLPYVTCEKHRWKHVPSSRSPLCSKYPRLRKQDGLQRTCVWSTLIAPSLAASSLQPKRLDDMPTKNMLEQQWRRNKELMKKKRGRDGRERKWKVK